MNDFPRFFFLVGVDTYSDSTRDLRSGVNDVLDALHFLLDIGADTSHVVVATSPALTAEQAVNAYASRVTDPAAQEQAREKATAAVSRIRFFAASREAILTEAVPALSTMWAGKDAEMGYLGLNWSGHGQKIDGVYYLCPSDAAGHARPGAADTMIRYQALMEAIGLSEEDSVMVLLDTCDAGAVSQDDFSGRPNDLILTAGGPDQTVRERYLDGQWRGLVNWSFHRVLDQFNARGASDTMSSGMDLSYGTVIRDIRALVTVFQGVEPTPAVPQIYGSMADAPRTLQRRVGQCMIADPGHSSFRSTKVGGEVQMWGDVEKLTFYRFKVSGELAGYIFIYNSVSGSDVVFDYQHGESRNTSALIAKNSERWLLKASAIPSNPTSYAFELVNSYSIVNGIATIPAADLNMTSAFKRFSSDPPLILTWPSAESKTVSNYTKPSQSGIYAFKIEFTVGSTSNTAKLFWVRENDPANPGPTPNPFKKADGTSKSAAFALGAGGLIEHGQFVTYTLSD